MQRYIELANSISGMALDSPDAHKEGAPEVKLLASVISEELAEVALMCTDTPMTASQVAQRAGVPVRDMDGKLAELGQIGILFIRDGEDGQTYYNRVPWVPGIMEHLLLNQSTRNPTVAKFFDEVGFSRAKATAHKVPMGSGFMRVIPIGQSVKATSKTATYEELQTYLDASDYYSVADCACRTAKRLLGDACEHPVEDMCIQIGPEAEYYVRTGRARRVTRKEAEEIILRAEREGLVHEIFNNEGVHESSFICNCCGCSCSLLRRAGLMNVTDYMRSNFVARVDEEKCVACGACVEACNTNALILGDKLSGHKPETITETPLDVEWGEDKWDLDFRKRRMVTASGTSPCKTKCPAHISIQGYIRLAAQGRYADALKVVKRDNPFPAVCGRVCPHTCEAECTRGGLDDPLAIDDIKKFVADLDLRAEEKFVPAIHEQYEEKIAIVGGGPAGLSCAYYLAVSGYPVTVFEKNSRLGGMLSAGIPPFRLEHDVIDAEIDVIRQLGVDFKTGVNVGTDVSLNDLRREGFKAFYLAIGAQDGRKLNIDGEDTAGVLTGVEFLRSINLSGNVKLDGDTVVIGGGNVAIDVARSAVRVCDGTVNLFCIESQLEMPALKEEQDEAKEEGIKINNGWGPKRILAENGKVAGVEFIRCISVFNDSGTFAPMYDETDAIAVRAKNVIISVGQSINWGGILENSTIKLKRGNTLDVHEISFQSAEPDVFAGGDAVTGPKFAIDAIAAGKQGATSIHRFLRGRGMLIRREREFHPLTKENLNLAGFDSFPRQKPPVIDHEKATQSFRDLRANLTEKQVRLETSRCLSCGVSFVDEYKCIGCGVCATKCEFDAIALVRKYDVGSYSPEEHTHRIKEHAKQLENRLKISRQ